MRGKGGWYAGFETVSNFRMSFREWRPARRNALAPVIALHGSLGCGGMWSATAEGAGTLRMICPDQRGYGRTEDPGGGDAAADFARDVIGLADALLLDRFVVMGHSFAGAVALAAAAGRPDRVAGTVLMDPTTPDGADARASLEAARDRPTEFGSLAEARKFITSAEEGHWPPAETERFLSDVLTRGDADGALRAPYEKGRLLRLREFQASSASDYDPVFWAKRTECPALVLRGGKSRRFSAEAEKSLLDALPGKSRAALCARAGHFPTVSQPSVVRRELRKFLAELR